jgi:hypothetical protein
MVVSTSAAASSVAGAEVAQERIGDVRVEDFGGPFLPPPEERRQVVDEAKARMGLQQRDRRGR